MLLICPQLRLGRDSSVLGKTHRFPSAVGCYLNRPPSLTCVRLWPPPAPWDEAVSLVLGPFHKTYLTVEDLKNTLLQRLAGLGPHKDVNNFQVGAGPEQLLHQHFAHEACGPRDEDGLAAVESRDHGHDSSLSGM